MAKKNGRMRRRGARYYVRRKVPRDLVPVLGKTEVCYALGTHDPDVARVRRDAENVRINAMFERARRLLRDGPVTQVSETDITHMAVAWFEQSERELAAADASARGINLDEVLTEMLSVEGSLLDQEDTMALSNVQHVADKVLRDNNVRISRDSREFDLLCKLVRRAMVESTRRGRDQLMDDHSGRSHDQMFRRTSAIATQRSESTTLEELIEMFTNDPERSRMRDKTETDYAMIFRVLRELWGPNKVVRNINRADCRMVKDLFAALPPNASKKFPAMSLTRAVEQARKKRMDPMNPVTANGHLNKVSTLLRWAEREEFIDRNPAVGLRVAAPKDSKREARDPFSTDQLRAIFNSPLFTGCKDDRLGYAVPGPKRPRRGRFWVPLIALFEGMRLSECCQLTVEDVTVRDGIDVILVRAGDGQRVKSGAGQRTIPVHPELMRIGFLAHVDKMRASGERQLFPELKRDRRGYRSDPFQKWFGRFLKKCGAKAPKTSFHSFRHCFRDALRESGAGRDAVLALGGWSTGGTEEIYGSGLRPSTLAREIAKVRYPGLDLDHLHT